MAKYNNSRFYWLQLKEDFFDEDAIDWLEDQPNGEKYSLFYLKLCLKSLRTNGILIRKVGTMLVPYDHIKLGELTKTDPDTVVVAMELLRKIGLVRMLDNGELYITQVENMIGSQSIGAFKKQQQLIRRENNLIEGGTEVEKIPPNIDIDKEIDIEQDIEKESKSKNVDYKAIIDCYNDTCVSFPKVKALSDSRKKSIKARLNTYSVEDIKTVFEKAEASDFLKGGNGRDWQANFDWLMKDSNFAKVLDGNYDNKGGGFNKPTQEWGGGAMDKYHAINAMIQNGEFDL